MRRGRHGQRTTRAGCPAASGRSRRTGALRPLPHRLRQPELGTGLLCCERAAATFSTAPGHSAAQTSRRRAQESCRGPASSRQEDSGARRGTGELVLGTGIRGAHRNLRRIVVGVQRSCGACTRLAAGRRTVGSRSVRLRGRMGRPPRAVPARRKALSRGTGQQLCEQSRPHLMHQHRGLPGVNHAQAAGHSPLPGSTVGGAPHRRIRTGFEQERLNSSAPVRILFVLVLQCGFVIYPVGSSLEHRR